MLVASDDALAEKARLLRTHGSKPKYYHKLVGANFRLDSIQARYLQCRAASDVMRPPSLAPWVKLLGLRGG